jgi:heme exporter protein D
MKCSIKAMFTPERKKSILGEFYVWLVFTAQLVALSLLVIITLKIDGSTFNDLAGGMLASCGVFSAMVLWVEDLHKYPYRAGSGDYHALESDQQIHARNHRVLHSFRMKFTPVFFVGLLVGIYYLLVWLASSLAKLAIVSAFIDLF